MTLHDGTNNDLSDAFCQLVALIEALRSENGCPWDREQTPLSFHPYILEEYHELVHAIRNGDDQEIAEELGDLIFLVVFVAYMFQQLGKTNLVEVLATVVEKMRRRHPHVFGDVSVGGSADVIANWRKIKATEESVQRRGSILDGIPRSLPALSRSQKLASRAAGVGFDWTRPEEVMKKVHEELQEFKEALASKDAAKIREELGDLLFVIANVSRHLGIDSESALAEAADKFENRFRYIEEALTKADKSIQHATLEEMDRLWDQAKMKENEPRP